MVVQGFWPLFGCGVAGGALVELLRWWKLRENPDFPAYATSIKYWAITLIMICAGGGISILYGLEPRNALMAVNVGASAPAIIAAFSVQQPSVLEDRSGTTRTRAAGERRAKRNDSIRSFLGFGT